MPVVGHHVQRGKYRSSQPFVVVVESDANTVAFVCSALAMASITAVGCPCNARAQAYIRYKRPDIVFLTCSLVDGPEWNIFTSLRADPRTEKIAYVFSTNYGDQFRTKLEAYNPHMVQFLPSPYPLDALVRLVLEASSV